MICFVEFLELNWSIRNENGIICYVCLHRQSRQIKYFDQAEIEEIEYPQ